MIKVLFVCTGNICRSPTAEGIFRHLAAETGLLDSFLIDSAGTDSYHVGEAPDRRAIRIADSYGVSLQGQAARQLEISDFLSFDYIYAMDSSHLQEMKRRLPKEARARLQLFLDDAADLAETDVPDPWYGDEEDFVAVFNLVETGATAILQRLRKEHDL